MWIQDGGCLNTLYNMLLASNNVSMHGIIKRHTFSQCVLLIFQKITNRVIESIQEEFVVTLTNITRH